MKKHYIFKGVAIAVLAFVITGFYFCTPQLEDKQVGIQLWSVREDIKKDLEGTIKALGEMGYTYVEAAGYGNGKFYGLEPNEFKTLVEASGMIFLSSHTGRNVPAPEQWDSTMMWWDTCIDAHVAAGVKYIVQPSMGRSAYSSIEGLKDYCDYFNAVGDKCNAKGIRFGYHNHAGEFSQLENVTIYDYMLENTDPEKVMFQLDLYWIYKGDKNSVDYFNKYPGRFELFHVKDTAELGTGVMDFRLPFENAGKAGMKHYIVEVEVYNFEPLESVKRSLEYIKQEDYIK